MSLIIPANTLASSGFSVDNSVRFNSGSSDYLSKTPDSASNRKTFTISTWIKRSKLGASQFIYNVRPGAAGAFAIFFTDADVLYLTIEPISKTLVTNRVFRDISAWYHIVYAIDTTQGTDTNRIKLYVNGVQETSFSAASYPDENADLDVNTANPINIGRRLENSSDFIGAYFSEFAFIDGLALAADSFGEFDDSGIWKPISVSGLTFGTNGFYLDFENSGALGADVSGNSNNFTVNNLTAIDQSTDTCTNNFITMNPLDSYYSASTFSEGNLKIVSSSGNYSPDMGTIGLSAGKWYWEVKIDTTSTEDMIGITGNQRLSSGSSTSHLGGMLYDFAYNSYAKFYNNNGNVSYGATFGNNDIIGVALDLDSGTNTIQFYKNGSAQGSKNITHVSSTENGFYHVSAGDFTSGASMTFSSNFGSPSYSESGGETDGNGYGNFANAVPSGYYALNTKNLAEYG